MTFLSRVSVAAMVFFMAGCSTATNLAQRGDGVSGCATVLCTAKSSLASECELGIERQTCGSSAQETQSSYHTDPDSRVEQNTRCFSDIEKLRRKKSSQVPELTFPVPAGCLSSPFGYRHGSFHSGVDITARRGEPILACADGRVISAGVMKGYRRYGKMVIIDHGKDVYTRYAHASRILVRSGQKVRKGQQIALVGSTGRSTSPHLHLEVQTGEQLHNPVVYFSAPQLKRVRVAKNFNNSPLGPIRSNKAIVHHLSSRR
jgi:murein DD-endopeptidase MepM/ murein hydrolase activator NlpD